MLQAASIDDKVADFDWFWQVTSLLQINFETCKETKKIQPIGAKIDKFESKMAEFEEKVHRTEQLQHVAREVEFRNKTKLTSFLKRGENV